MGNSNNTILALPPPTVEDEWEVVYIHQPCDLLVQHLFWVPKYTVSEKPVNQYRAMQDTL